MPSRKREVSYNDLGHWIAEVTQWPTWRLEQEFSRDYAVVASIILMGGDDPSHSLVFALASDESLTLLHSRFRGLSCEDDVWGAVIDHLTHPLPKAVANDLLDRNLAIGPLIHSIQEPSVQWRMAREYGNEAILGLGIDFYGNPRRSSQDFGAVIEAFGQDYWLLRTLLGYTASSREKEYLLFETVKAHVQRDELLETRAQIAIEKAERGKALEEAYLLSEQAKATTDPEELRALTSTRHPDVLLTVAKHPATPPDVLLELTRLEHVHEAKRIRHAALENLRRRGIKTSNRPRPPRAAE